MGQACCSLPRGAVFSTRAHIAPALNECHDTAFNLQSREKNPLSLLSASTSWSSMDCPPNSLADEELDAFPTGLPTHWAQNSARKDPYTFNKLVESSEDEPYESELVVEKPPVRHLWRLGSNAALRGNFDQSPIIQEGSGTQTSGKDGESRRQTFRVGTNKKKTWGTYVNQSLSDVNTVGQDTIRLTRQPLIRLEEPSKATPKNWNPEAAGTLSEPVSVRTNKIVFDSFSKLADLNLDTKEVMSKAQDHHSPQDSNPTVVMVPWLPPKSYKMCTKTRGADGRTVQNGAKKFIAAPHSTKPVLDKHVLGEEPMNSVNNLTNDYPSRSSIKAGLGILPRIMVASPPAEKSSQLLRRSDTKESIKSGQLSAKDNSSFQPLLFGAIPPRKQSESQLSLTAGNVLTSSNPQKHNRGFSVLNQPAAKSPKQKHIEEESPDLFVGRRGVDKSFEVVRNFVAPSYPTRTSAFMNESTISPTKQLDRSFQYESYNSINDPLAELENIRNGTKKIAV